jgi:hypothetical protein
VTENIGDFSAIADAADQRGQSHYGLVLVDPDKYPRGNRRTIGRMVRQLVACWPVILETRQPACATGFDDPSGILRRMFGMSVQPAGQRSTSSRARLISRPADFSASRALRGATT